MTSDTTASSTGHRKATVLEQSPLLVALVLLWMMLWGSVSPLTILTGIILAVLVTRAFYLPPVELSDRFNPFWFAVFLGRFVGELVAASFQVAFQALSRRPAPSSAIVRVDLVTRSDFIMTGTAIAISLVPGSVILEIDRADSVLYIHTLNVHDAAGVEKARHHVLSFERALLRAWGSRDEWEKVR